VKVTLEIQPRDLWVGAYLKRDRTDGRLHVWICPVPMLAIHLAVGRDRRQLAGAPPAHPPRRWPGRVGTHGIIRRRPIH
jgi:hypothetical protein